jgi:hypothetical protein
MICKNCGEDYNVNANDAEFHQYDACPPKEDKSNRLEKLGYASPASSGVQTAGHSLERYIPEDYEIVEEPSLLKVYNNDKEEIEDELYMQILLRKKS